MLKATTAGAFIAGTLAVTGGGADAGTTTHAEFGYTGGAQTLVVPDNVCQMTVDLVGAGGNPELAPSKEYDLIAAGGLGGRATAVITVTPGETLTIMVGGQGGAGLDPRVGGFNGGGDGGDLPGDPGAGGGGATDIRRAPNGLADRLVVAGGGGGGAPDEADFGLGGDGGGTVGQDGTPSDYGPVPAGGGGTQSAGGLAPTGYDPTATNGSLGQGGQGGIGTDDEDAGGGGGGGYYGGGGGAGADYLNSDDDDGGGGGGGSGFGPAGVTFGTASTLDDGSATVDWVVGDGCTEPTTTTTATAAAAAVAVTPRFTG